jgi:hypothetical protein
LFSHSTEVHGQLAHPALKLKLTSFKALNCVLCVLLGRGLLLLLLLLCMCVSNKRLQ